MAKIPFNVDANTARLIGRQNVAKLDGAIMELIKNAYDADATKCWLYYEASSKSLILADNGCGMDESVILNNWMTIGRSSKTVIHRSKNGRVQTGEKGIGRFALDRIGDWCEMLTMTAGKKLLWQVHWDSFDFGKSITDVTADLSETNDTIEQFLGNIKNHFFVKCLNEDLLESGTGTIFFIQSLRDEWNNAMVNGEGNKAGSTVKAIEDSYQKEVFDEFVEPTVICNGEEPVATIGKHDSIIFFNFRPDRAREITRTLVDPEFNEFETKKDLDLYFVCFTNYDETMPNVHIAFKKEPLHNTFGEYISKLGYTQLRIAETEKYAHVTFFFNGGEEKQYPGEDRILVPSPKVETYDQKPEMSAYEVTDKVLEAIKSDKYDSIILNYANTDMVGHTGSLEAAIKAVETVDECLGKVVNLVEEKQGNLIITADHGNAEQMIDYKTGEPHTAHTTNPVPIILVTPNKDLKLKSGGKLADLAPTMLDLMNLEKPEEMTGESLLDKE